MDVRTAGSESGCGSALTPTGDRTSRTASWLTGHQAAPTPGDFPGFVMAPT